jgi:hypothetical protein
MEAWKFTDYTTLDTLSALSLTAARWGLGPFPDNLDVEHLGDVVIGPSNANIVSVVHGVSLIITLIAMAKIFGMLDRLTNRPKPGTEGGLNGDDLKSYYNQPFNPQDRITPAPTHSAGCPAQMLTDVEKAKRITACSDLLRKRYDTQVQIWSCQNEQARAELQRKSDAMHNDIRTTVWRWKTQDYAAWSEDELVQIEGIWAALSAQ